jgi:lipid-binding SYLF domain-containing protein
MELVHSPPKFTKFSLERLLWFVVPLFLTAEILILAIAGPAAATAFVAASSLMALVAVFFEKTNVARTVEKFMNIGMSLAVAVGAGPLGNHANVGERWEGEDYFGVVGRKVAGALIKLSKLSLVQKVLIGVGVFAGALIVSMVIVAIAAARSSWS